MSLGLITRKDVYGKTVGVPTIPVNVLSEVNTANPIFMIDENMDGEKEAIYHMNIIYLLDKVFMNDSMNFLSIEQTKYLDKFFNEAGIVTDAINNYEDDPYINMHKIMKQLDNFLGNYFGVNDGRYSR